MTKIEVVGGAKSIDKDGFIFAVPRQLQFGNHFVKPRNEGAIQLFTLWVLVSTEHVLTHELVVVVNGLKRIVAHELHFGVVNVAQSLNSFVQSAYFQSF